MLDGAARVEGPGQAAVADGQPALGITDHGNMYGVLDFYAACRKAGINPVIGTEAYMAAESRHDRPVRKGKVDDTGGDVDGGREALLPPHPAGRDHRGLPEPAQALLGRLPRGLLLQAPARLGAARAAQHRLIATTGCLGGVVLQALLADDQVKAETWPPGSRTSSARTTSSSNCRTTGSPSSTRPTRPWWRSPGASAPRCWPPTTATTPTAATTWPTTPCSASRPVPLIDDPKRFKFEGQEHYLKSAAEMRHLFAELPEACDNTLLIAERAYVEIEFGRPSLPQFPVPDEFTGDTYEERAARYLRHLSIEGAKERYGSPSRPTCGAARLRARRHRGHGLLGLLPRGVGPHPLRPLAGDPGRARAAVRPPAAAWPTASRSSTSTPSATTSSSSASSTPAASRCPTSTWTSTSGTAAT